MHMTGDWSGAIARLRAFPDRMRAELQLATKQNAVGLEGEIKEGMVKQAPGGVPYRPLHPFTIAMRLAGMSTRRAAKVQASPGGHKALINHGDLLGSITHRLYGDGLSAAVGVSRKARAKNGRAMVDIARVVFYGKVIQVTPKMRAFLHGAGLHLARSTTAIVIPPRPTIEPAFRAYRPTIRARYARALARAAKWGR